VLTATFPFRCRERRRHEEPREPKGAQWGRPNPEYAFRGHRQEETYEKLNQLVAQLQDVRDRLESTSEQVESMDRELAEQRAIVEALAAQQGVDVDAVVAEVYTGAETGTEEAGPADQASDETTDSETTDEHE
jgi:hypothetical protein